MAAVERRPPRSSRAASDLRSSAAAVTVMVFPKPEAQAPLEFLVPEILQLGGALGDEIEVGVDQQFLLVRREADAGLAIGRQFGVGDDRVVTHVGCETLLHRWFQSRIQKCVGAFAVGGIFRNAEPRHVGDEAFLRGDGQDVCARILPLRSTRLPHDAQPHLFGLQCLGECLIARINARPQLFELKQRFLGDLEIAGLAATNERCAHRRVDVLDVDNADLALVLGIPKQIHARRHVLDQLRIIEDDLAAVDVRREKRGVRDAEGLDDVLGVLELGKIELLQRVRRGHFGDIGGR